MTYNHQTFYRHQQMPQPADIKDRLTELKGVPLFYWLADKQFTYGFFGAGRIARAAEFVSLLRNSGRVYNVGRQEGTVAVYFEV